MKYNFLGKSDVRISTVGFGCMSLGRDDTENAKLITGAIDAGINYFDTADLYQQGDNEITLGKAIKPYRSKVVIATKVGNQLKPDGKGWIWNPSKEYILSGADKSLERLGTDYIDLYQLHGGTINDPIDETIEAFEMLVAAGKIRYYGISSIRPEVIREYVALSRINSVMMQYSLLDRRPEEACLSLLHDHKISVLARGSLAGGLLAGKYARPYLNYSEDVVHKVYLAVQSISGPERSMAQTAMRFVLQQPGITSAVVGIRTQEQLQDAIGAADAPALTESEIQFLKNSLPVNYYEQYR